MRPVLPLLLALLAAAPALAQAPAAPAPPAPALQQSPVRFVVFNTGREAIVSVQASPVTDRDWGQNLIGRVHIPPGAALAIMPRDRSTCLFDMRVTWADGRQIERRRENFCGVSRVYRLDGAQGR